MFGEGWVIQGDRIIQNTITTEYMETGDRGKIQEKQPFWENIFIMGIYFIINLMGVLLRFGE